MHLTSSLNHHTNSFGYNNNNTIHTNNNNHREMAPSTASISAHSSNASLPPSSPMNNGRSSGI